MSKPLKGFITYSHIILEHCDWQQHQLSEFQALPDRGKPINEWQPESIREKNGSEAR